MFYVIDGKIYEVNKNPKTNLHHEVKVTRDEDGNYGISVLKTGIPKRLKGSSRCTLLEVFAQFGGAASKSRTRMED